MSSKITKSSTLLDSPSLKIVVPCSWESPASSLPALKWGPMIESRWSLPKIAKIIILYYCIVIRQKYSGNLNSKAILEIHDVIELLKMFVILQTKKNTKKIQNQKCSNRWYCKQSMGNRQIVEICHFLHSPAVIGIVFCICIFFVFLFVFVLVLCLCWTYFICLS